MNAIQSPYAGLPGFKVEGTSKEAAIEVKEDAKTLRALCLEVVTLRGDKTADETADILGQTPFSIRPRFTELARLGRIFDSGVRRKNASGSSAIVWTVIKPSTKVP